MGAEALTWPFTNWLQTHAVPLLAKPGCRSTHGEPDAPTGLRHPMYLLDAPSPLTEA
jgi:hypothetical protein